MEQEEKIPLNNVYAAILKEKIKSQIAKIAVIGLGYVGLPLAVEKAKVGFNVTGIDRDSKRVQQLNKGHNYIKDVRDEDLKSVLESNKLWATDNFELLKEVDVVVICVPTPLTKTRDPDVSFIEAATDQVARYLRRGQLITLESTTFPGTTQELVLPKLESTGLKVGVDFFLAFSPERVDPGNQLYTTKNTTKVVGGVTSTCLDIAYSFYKQTIPEVITVSSPAVAEMTKIFENTYRSVNIAMVNEMMFLCDKMGIDIWEVVEAAGTKPFGIHTFHPGPGVGGHCIPIDPHYLTWKAKEFDFATKFIELAGQVNLEASSYVVSKVKKVLNDRKKTINGSRILIMGVAYKRDVDDIRESPALKIIQLLVAAKGLVVYHDPYVPLMESHRDILLSAASVSLTAQEIAQADCVLIITDHSCIDYAKVVEHAQIVIDCRNATKKVQTGRDKIIKI